MFLDTFLKTLGIPGQILERSWVFLVHSRERLGVPGHILERSLVFLGSFLRDLRCSWAHSRETPGVPGPIPESSWEWSEMLGG